MQFDQLHPTVKLFAIEMQKELDANNNKGNWELRRDVNLHLIELEYHKAKLLIALRAVDKPAVKEYLADCANLLMFIGASGLLYKEEKKALRKTNVSASLPLTDSDEWFVNNLKCIIDFEIELVKKGKQICVDRKKINKWISNNGGNDR